MKEKMKVIGMVLMALLVAGCFFVFPTASVSMKEVESFLANDTTSEQLYNRNQIPYYTCGHFTNDLVENANQEGIKMYPVHLVPRWGYGHIIAAVEVNATWVFIEPINDKTYTLQSLERVYKRYMGHWIGTHVRCSPFSPGSLVEGLVEMEMW